jgi:hypothetical protein
MTGSYQSLGKTAAKPNRELEGLVLIFAFLAIFGGYLNNLRNLSILRIDSNS